MQLDFTCEVKVPTKDECDQIALQVINEVKAVFHTGGNAMMGAAMVGEIAERIRARVEVCMTVNRSDTSLAAPGPVLGPS